MERLLAAAALGCLFAAVVVSVVRAASPDAAPVVTVISAEPTLLGPGGSSTLRWQANKKGQFSVAVGSNCAGTVIASGSYKALTVVTTTVLVSALVEGANTVTVCLTQVLPKGSRTGTASVELRRDTTPPVLTLPAEMTVEAAGPSGAVVEFSASADDAVDGPVGIECSPASGSSFALGETTVTCTATDARGNTASGGFKVIVQDTTPPTLSGLPSDIATEATGADGAAVSYAATSATDLVDGDLDASCTPASGSTFALVETTVTCTAADTHGNAASGTFKITVLDTTPPTLALPDDLTVTATEPTVVSYAASATDAVDGTAPVTCAPESGATFAFGETAVWCSATDAHGNLATGSFLVTVVQTDVPPEPVAPLGLLPFGVTSVAWAVAADEPATMLSLGQTAYLGTLAALDCDPYESRLGDEVVQGCPDVYLADPTLTTCPFTASSALWTSPQPWACVPLVMGTVVAQLEQGVQTRFAGCPTNNWSAYPNISSDDPRLVRLFQIPEVQPQSGTYPPMPILALPKFYVTGWYGDSCPGDTYTRVGGSLIGHFVP